MLQEHVQEELVQSWIQREVSSPQTGLDIDIEHLASAKRARSGPSRRARCLRSTISLFFSRLFVCEYLYAPIYLCISLYFDSFTLFSLHSTVFVIAT